MKTRMRKSPSERGEQHVREHFTDILPEQLERTFRTNLFSYFFMAREVRKYLDEGDSILTTASITAYRGSDHLVDYASSKGAIVAFTRSLAQQCGPDGIRVNAVAPGPIWTPLIPASFSADRVERFGEETLLGRAGQPCEVGPAYVFLASDDASYFTGQTLHPNGGSFVNS